MSLGCQRESPCFKSGRFGCLVPEMSHTSPPDRFFSSFCWPHPLPIRLAVPDGKKQKDYKTVAAVLEEE